MGIEQQQVTLGGLPTSTAHKTAVATVGMDPCLHCIAHSLSNVRHWWWWASHI